MKVLHSWLRELAPQLPEDPAAIAAALGALGTPVEDEVHIGAGLDGIVVARVLGTRPHPKADRIQLVDVDLGDGEALQICCGAFNMAAGDLVPLATLGTTMPDGLEIARRKLRGEWSNGMLCSATELRLPTTEEDKGILVLGDLVAPDTALGTPIRDALGIEPDVLWDLEINPNRPDAMSIAGVARDLAAWFDVPFTLPDPQIATAGPEAAASVTVAIEDPERCGRFTATVLRGVQVRPSPRHIARRLELLGMRPINNVVDASNYVMLELGQPSHPYDLERLGGGGLKARRAAPGEKVTTLDGVERTCTDEDLLICDARDVPQGIAGIMGGADGEISDTTTEVALEMAWFLPINIAKSSRRLALRSEASARFEKGTDPEIAALAHARFAELLGDAVGEVAPGMVDVRGTLPDRTPVEVPLATINGVLGTELDGPAVKALLDPIGFTTEVGDGAVTVAIPSWRYDSAVAIDVVEEVARHHGYENLGKAMPTAVRIGALTPRQRERRVVRDVLVGLGLAEAMPLSFLAPGDLARSGLSDAEGITITNPLVAEESVLRPSLLPGLLRTAAYNQARRVTGAGFFELGHVVRKPSATFEPAPDRTNLPDEREVVAVALVGREAPAAVEAWEALAGALAVPDRALVADARPGLHPTRTARIEVAGVAVGHVGEVDPGVTEAWSIGARVAWLEVDLDVLLALPHGQRTYQRIAKYPSSDVDLAFDVAEAVPAGAVHDALATAAGDLAVSLGLFDVYRGEGVEADRRSLAFRLRLQAHDHTLTDAEVAEVRGRCIEAVTATLDARLRS